MEESRKFVELIFGADEIVGKGTIVDSYVGIYEPTGQFSGLPYLEVIAELDRFERNLAKRIFSSSQVDAIDMLETCRSLRLFLTYKSTKEDEDYSKQIESMYDESLLVVSEEDISRTRRELSSLLGLIGYKGNWPNNIKEWRSDSEISANGKGPRRSPLSGLMSGIRSFAVFCSRAKSRMFFVPY